MPPYRTSGCIYASLPYLRVYYMPPWVLPGVYASLGVLTRVYASPPPVSLVGVYLSLPTTRFTVGCVPQPLSLLPVSLLGVPQLLSHHPFHCWVFLSLSPITRFTVGHTPGSHPPTRFTVGQAESLSPTYPFHCWARKEAYWAIPGYSLPPCQVASQHRIYASLPASRVHCLLRRVRNEEGARRVVQVCS